MISPRSLVVQLLPLAAAAGLAAERPLAFATRFEGTRFSLALPPGWSKTMHVSCERVPPPGGDECWEEARFRGPAGAWLSVVADGPAEDAAARATVTATLTADGALIAPRPSEPVRAISIAARRGGRSVVVVAGSEGEAPLKQEDLGELVAAFRAK